jgi:hypothetical protein
MLCQMLGLADRSVEQVAAAIGANLVEPVSAIGAESALERTDKGTVHLRGQIHAAFFAIRSHFKH